MKINGTISRHNSCYIFKIEKCAQKQQIIIAWLGIGKLPEVMKTIQLEPEYTEEELRQIEEAASAQRREIENNQSLCRRIFRHFFDREIVRIFFSLKFCLPNVKTTNNKKSKEILIE
jgi:hypothetical protein